MSKMSSKILLMMVLVAVAVLSCVAFVIVLDEANERIDRASAQETRPY